MEASTEVTFMEYSAKASTKASMEVFTKVSRAWKRGSFYRFHESFHASMDAPTFSMKASTASMEASMKAAEASMEAVQAPMEAMKNLPSKMQMVQVAQHTSQLTCI